MKIIISQNYLIVAVYNESDPLYDYYDGRGEGIKVANNVSASVGQKIDPYAENPLPSDLTPGDWSSVLLSQTTYETRRIKNILDDIGVVWDDQSQSVQDWKQDADNDLEVFDITSEDCIIHDLVLTDSQWSKLSGIGIVSPRFIIRSWLDFKEYEHDVYLTSLTTSTTTESAEEDE